MSAVLEAGLWLAERHIPVVALHAVDSRGRCTCGCADPTCGNRGKHPRYDPQGLPHGLNSATTDPDRIRSWWSTWPDANLAQATGERSGEIVLDLDPRNGGHASLGALVRKYGPLPETP